MIYESRTIAEVVADYMALTQAAQRAQMVTPRVRLAKVIAWYRPTHVQACKWVPQESRGRVLVMPAGRVA